MIRKLLLLIIFIIFPVLTFGQSIWTNPITGNTNSNNIYTTGDSKNANIIVSGISRGSGTGNATATDSYSASGWTTGNNIDLTDYFEFSMTPNSGFKIDLVSFVYNGAVNNGPTRFVLRSSVDNYASNIDGVKTSVGGTFSLTGNSYQNISSKITFRIYGYDSNNNTNTFRINDFTFNGTVCSSPVTTGASICQGGTGSLTSTTNGVTANTFTGSWNAATDATASIPTTSMNNNTNCGFVAGIVRNYTATTFTVSTTGVYTFKMTDTNAYDGMAYIYSGNFTPGTCPGGGNWIIGDDDNSGLNAEPRMTPTLTAGVLYTLISTTYSESSGTYSGNYTWTVTPPTGGQVTTSPVSWYTAATGGTAIGAGSPFNPVGVAGSGLANTNTVGTTTYYAASGGSCTRTPTTFVINGDTPTTSLGTYTFCIDNSMTQTTANATAGQYALVNVVKGYNYTFTVGNVFASNNEKLNILDAATDLEVTPTANNTSASGATISNWVAPFSGQIKVVLSTGSCSNIGIAGTGGIALTLNSIGDTQETQNEFGTNTWVGHIYNAGGSSPEPFVTANYAGTYNIATETINEGFGGDANCFPVYSNGVQRASILTEGMAVRYKMKTTKSGCYLITMTGDDGIRLFLNGTKVFDRWVQQVSTTYSNVLVNLDGDDDLVFDYYENGGGNVVGFSMTAFNAGANTITAPATVTFCSNGDPAVIEGSLQYNSNDVNFQNPQLNFQWQISTDGSSYTDISGANGRTYDPPAIVNNTAANIVRRFKRLVTLNTANVPNINNVRTSCLYNESNIVTITTTPTAVISATTALTCTGVAFTVTPTGTIPAGTTYSWGIPTVTGGITGGTANTGSPTSITGTLLNPSATAQTATYTVTPTSAGCAGATFTVTVTVNPLPTPTFTAQPAASTCIGTSVIYTTQGAMSNYVWGFPGTAGTNYTIVSGGTSADNTVTLRYLTAGSKTVTINYTNVPNSCTATSATSSSATTVNALPTPTFTAQPAASTCIGTSVTYTTQGAMSNYVWGFPGVAGTDYAIISGGTSNDSSVTLRYLTTGSKTVTINYTTVPNSCTATSATSSSATTVNALPTPTFTAQPAASTCIGTSVTYTTQGAMSNYVWGFPGTAGTNYTIVSGGTSADNTVTLRYLTTGSKTVTINYTTVPNSCTATSATSSSATTVNALPTPTFTAQPAGSTCIGTSVTYTTQAAMSNYVWGFPGTAGTDYTIVSGGTSADNTVTLRYLTSGSKTVTINYTTVPNGCTATSATSSSAITVNALPTTPSIAVQTEVNCTTSGSVTLNNLPAGNWTINQTGFASNTINNTGTSYTVTGLAAGTYRFTVSNGTCTSSVSSDVTILDQSSTTWSGTAWSNGTPDASKAAIIAGAYTISSDLTACSLTINPAIAITVPSNYTLTVVNALTVSPTASLTFENHSSLVQVNDNAVNSGNIKYKRIAPKIRRGDFVYWSTPVSPQKLIDVSPLTLGDKYFGYSGDNWVITNKNTVMKVGKGYIIRGPQTYSLTVKADYPAEFNGVPNNGVILGETLTAGKPYLIGNPYPSALSAKKFLDQNTAILEGTLYFWTHNTPVTLTGAYTYTSDDYASYNLTGSTVVKERAITGGTPGNNNEEPSGFIGAGQSFFATSKAGGTVTFNNDMRLGAADNTQFFKSASKETTDAHRVWLNMTNTKGVFKQMLVGYVQGATNEYEDRYDGVSFNANPYVDFYSVDNGNNYVIQGRALPFTDTDQVPLGYNTTITGDFTISIDKTDGDLSSHAIYLEDKKTGVIHDLTTSDYTFTTEKGTFSDRLVLRYTNKTLGTGDFENIENGLLVSVKDKTIKVTSSAENIKEVTVFDISGKLLYSKKKAGTTELQIQNLQSANQVLLVKVTLENDFTATKKIIFN